MEGTRNEATLLELELLVNYAVPVAKFICTCCEVNEFVMQASSWEELQLAVESRVMSAEQAIGLEKGSYKGLNYNTIV